MTSDDGVSSIGVIPAEDPPTLKLVLDGKNKFIDGAKV